ncbi:hypothetical protein J6590_010344 [Homalodisca vitripennis]|nr:hypothetical protein J6590_010344 [Homalodisca vitripennis]
MCVRQQPEEFCPRSVERATWTEERITRLTASTGCLLNRLYCVHIFCAVELPPFWEGNTFLKFKTKELASRRKIKEETWILAYLKFAGATTSMLPRLGWLWGEAPEITARQHTSTQLCAGTGQKQSVWYCVIPDFVVAQFDLHSLLGPRRSFHGSGTEFLRLLPHTHTYCAILSTQFTT